MLLSAYLAILFLLPIFHTYIVYPTYLWLRRPGKSSLQTPPSGPFKTAIIMAARNEAMVIETKIRSIFENSSMSPTEVWVGSDASTDNTVEILQRLSSEFPSLQFKHFENRLGKSGVLNALVIETQCDFLVCTDANVIWQPNTLEALLTTLHSAPNVQMVAAQVNASNKFEGGIASEENAYLNLENKIKKAESRLWNLVMGVEGGCFLIRKSSWVPIPEGTLVDDFFLNMSVLLNGGHVLWAEHAQCMEALSSSSEQQYERKKRISQGNLQNLKRFLPRVFKPFWPLGFAFLSHKVFRWISPQLFLFALLFSVWPAWYGMDFHRWFISLSLVFWILAESPLARFKPFKGLRHFYKMNLAMLHGFMLYVNNRQQHVWEPTNRNP